jgi:hypothetical protein
MKFFCTPIFDDWPAKATRPATRTYSILPTSKVMLLPG